VNKIVIFHGRYTKGFFKPEPTTRGTAATGEFDEIGVTSRFTKRINANLIDIRGTGSNKRQYHPPGKQEFDWGVEFYLQDTDFITELITPTVPAVATSTIEVRDSGNGVNYKYWLYTGVLLDNLSISSRVGDPLIATATGGAMDVAISDSTSITDPSVPLTNTPWVWDDGSLSINAVNAPELIEYTLNVRHTGERRYGYNDNKPRDNISKDFHADGTIVFTTEYGAPDYIGDLLGDVEQDMIFYLNSTTEYITVSDAKFSRLDNPSEANTVLTETFSFEGKDAVVTG
jgi:hypothetical protein